MNAEGRLVVFVLDTTSGEPAHNLPVKLMVRNRIDCDWHLLTESVTDQEGCIENFTFTIDTENSPQYRLVYETAHYFEQKNMNTFFPRINVDFRLIDKNSVVLPLLISPFSYTTYKGS